MTHEEQNKKDWEKEFRDRFGIKVTPNSEKDATKAFLLERFWQETTLSEMIDFINRVVAENNKRIVKEVADSIRNHPRQPLNVDTYLEVVKKGNFDLMFDFGYREALSNIEVVLKLLDNTNK